MHRSTANQITRCNDINSSPYTYQTGCSGRPVKPRVINGVDQSDRETWHGMIAQSNPTLERDKGSFDENTISGVKSVILNHA